MPQEIISQFDRNYNAPIETYRQVANSTARDAIPGGIRWEGMVVYVVADGVSYELRGGTTNADWALFGGLEDAPNDGNYYARRNASWTILPAALSSGLYASTGVNAGNTAGNYDNLFGYTIPGGTLAVGDVIRIKAIVTTLTDSDDQINYQLGSNRAGIANPPSGSHMVDILMRCTAIGAAGTFRVMFCVMNATGDLVNATAYSATGVDTTGNVFAGINGGGTTVNSVVVNVAALEILKLN